MSHQILISILQKFTRQSRLTTLNEYLIKYCTLMYIFGSFMNEYLSKFLPHHLPLPSLPLIPTPPPPPKHFVRIQKNNHVLTPPPSSRSKLCSSPQRLQHFSSPTHHPWVFTLYLSYPSHFTSPSHHHPWVEGSKKVCDFRIWYTANVQEFFFSTVLDKLKKTHTHKNCHKN